MSLTLLVQEGKNNGKSLLVRLVSSLVAQGSVNIEQVSEEVFLKEHANKFLPLLHVDGGMTLMGGNTVAQFIIQRFSSEEETRKLLGESALEQAQIFQWTSFCSTELTDVMIPKSTLFSLNTSLSSKVFFVGKNMSLADLAMFSHLHGTVSGLSLEDQLPLCNLVRWFDYIQHQVKDTNIVSLVEMRKDFPFVYQKFKSNETKSKSANEKKQKKKESAEPAERRVEEGSAGQDGKDKKKKEKKEKKKKSKPQAQPKEVNVDVMDLRVGEIVDVNVHENADGLYVEKINVGEEEPRTIVSGLVKHIPIEEMRGRKVVVICNLKPAKMRGVASYGMVLAASHNKGSDDEHVVLVDVPKDSVAGDKITAEGYEGEPEKQLNANKTSKVMAEMKTNDNGTPCFKGVPLRTEHGECSSSLSNAIVS